MKKNCALFALILVCQFVYGQTLKIGILTDTSPVQTEPLITQLKTEIQAVIGQNTEVIFSAILENNYDTDLALTNYQTLVSDDTDIILSFGVINNVVLYQQKSYPKPTVVFGAVNNDFIELPEDQVSSEINNITYLIAPISYKEDLEVFKSIYNYKKIGIIVDDYLPEALPIKDLFDDYFAQLETDYKLIPISNSTDISSQLDDVDAVYLAGGFDKNDSEFKALIAPINIKKLPSFSAFGKRTVAQGVLASNQPETNLNQFFRHIALTLEAIYSGTNASDLPLYINYKRKLTINKSTANTIDFPLRYSILAKADFIGGNNFQSSIVSLSIIDIMRAVVNDNLNLKSEQKNIDLSSLELKSAKSNFLPDLSSSISGNYLDPKIAEISQGSNPEVTTSGNIALNQLIYSEQAKANRYTKQFK